MRDGRADRLERGRPGVRGRGGGLGGGRRRGLRRRRGRRGGADRGQLLLELPQAAVELGEDRGDVGRWLRFGHHARAYALAASSPAAISATSVGVRPTLTPRASSASAFAAAVPLEPETIAPAWPIVLPGGAVNPAM